MTVFDIYVSPRASDFRVIFFQETSCNSLRSRIRHRLAGSSSVVPFESYETLGAEYGSELGWQLAIVLGFKGIQSYSHTAYSYSLLNEQGESSIYSDM